MAAAQMRRKPGLSRDEWPAPPVTARAQKIRARVQPLVELGDPDVFEVNLMGNNMLPLVKRRSEFEQLSRQLEQSGAPSNTMPLQIARAGHDPAQAAEAIQVFLDSLLQNVGLDEDAQSPNCQLLKSFLGLRRTHDVDHFRANADGTVVRGKAPPRPSQRDDGLRSPRNALQPLHNHPNQFAMQQPHFAHQDVAPGPASIDEKAAALEKIRQRREALRAESHLAPQTDVGHPERGHRPADMLSAPEKADLVRIKLAEALHEDRPQAPAPSDEDAIRLHSSEFSTAAYSAAVPLVDDVCEKENAVLQPSVIKGITRRALRQAQVLVEQTSADSKLKTWINCTDEDYGLTFTQSLCGESSIFDIAIPKPAQESSATTPRKSTASANAAPAPMESTSTTSNRVGLMAGYTSSFRDIRSKFANAVGSIADQEYVGSLLTSQEAQVLYFSNRLPETCTV